MSTAKKTVPFAWQDKRILRRIREQCPNHGSAIAVYNALTVVGSDNQAEQFKTTHQWLAKLSGLSDRTVRRRLEDLKAIGAVEIETPRLRGPCTYTLLAFGHGVRTLGHGSAVSCPTSEESRKKKEESPPRANLGIADRISLEKKLRILEERANRLQGDTAEQWQRDEQPEKVTELQKVRAAILDLQDQLLGA